MDTSNFDEEFTREKPIDSVVDEYLSESVQKQFGGWTYVGNEQLGSSMVQGRSIRSFSENSGELLLLQGT